MLFLTLFLYLNHELGFEGIITCTLSMMGSFGPVVALSSLSNNLNQTLASGERVLSLLEEKPLVEEVEGDYETMIPLKELHLIMLLSHMMMKQS